MALRFVVGPDGAVVYDPSGKAISHGGDVTLTVAELVSPYGPQHLAERLGAPVLADIQIQVFGQITQRLLQLLSLAKKAGCCTVGADKVKQNRADFGCIILALDAGSDVVKAFPEGTPLVTKKALDTALGGVNTTVVGITRPFYKNGLAPWYTLWAEMKQRLERQ